MDRGFDINDYAGHIPRCTHPMCKNVKIEWRFHARGKDENGMFIACERCVNGQYCVGHHPGYTNDLGTYR